MLNKLKPAGTTSSMESAPTYTRYNTDTHTHKLAQKTKTRKEHSPTNISHSGLIQILYVLALVGFSFHICIVKHLSNLLSSFMRSAQLLSGNVMKIFRFRDRLAGGALYSGR